MRDQITRDIEAAIAQLKSELTELDQLRARKREELRHYRRALRLVEVQDGDVSTHSQCDHSGPSPSGKAINGL